VITAAANRDIDRLKKAEQVKTKWAEKNQAQPDNAKARLAAINLFPIPPVTISAGYHRSANKKSVETTQTENVEATKPQVRVSKPLQLVSKPPIFYTIQVGAYKTKIFAEKMIHSLADKGYNAFLALMPNKDKTPLYRVRVDQFEYKSKARQLARKLKNSEHLENFIIAQHPG
jgi:cell division protein FtsN